MRMLENIAREFPLLGDAAAHLLGVEYPSRGSVGSVSQSADIDQWYEGLSLEEQERYDVAHALKSTKEFKASGKFPDMDKHHDKEIARLEQDLAELESKPESKDDWENFYPRDSLSDTCWDTPPWKEDPPKTQEDWERCLETVEKNRNANLGDPSMADIDARSERERAYIWKQLEKFENPNEEPDEN